MPSKLKYIVLQPESGVIQFFPCVISRVEFQTYLSALCMSLSDTRTHCLTCLQPATSRLFQCSSSGRFVLEAPTVFGADSGIVATETAPPLTYDPSNAALWVLTADGTAAHAFSSSQGETRACCVLSL